MKNIARFTVLLIIYLILGVIFGGNHQYMLPIFITLYIVVHLYLMDTSKNYITNFIQLSGVLTVAFLIALFTNDVAEYVILEYLGSMVLSSLLIFYLKKNKNFAPSV